MKVVIEMTALGSVTARSLCFRYIGTLRGKYLHTSEGDLRILSLRFVATENIGFGAPVYSALSGLWLISVMFLNPQRMKVVMDLKMILDKSQKA